MSRLVFFGCSFTAGQELADHEFLNISFEECDEFKKKYERMSDFELYLSSATNTHFVQRMKSYFQHTYAKKFADMLGLSSISFAYPGSSIEDAYARFLMAHNDKHINPINDKIVFGLMSMSRYVNFDVRDGDIMSTVLNQLENNELLNYHNDYHIIWNYYTTLQLFKKDAENKGYTIKFVPMHYIEHYDINNEEFFKIYSISKHWFMCEPMRNIFEEIKTHLITTKSLQSFKTENRTESFCRFGHFKECVHENFAKHLYEENINKIWWK